MLKNYKNIRWWKKETIYAEIYLGKYIFSLYKANQTENQNNNKKYYWILLKKLNSITKKNNIWENKKIMVKQFYNN